MSTAIKPANVANITMPHNYYVVYIRTDHEPDAVICTSYAAAIKYIAWDLYLLHKDDPSVFDEELWQLITDIVVEKALSNEDLIELWESELDAALRELQPNKVNYWILPRSLITMKEKASHEIP